MPRFRVLLRPAFVEGSGSRHPYPRFGLWFPPNPTPPLLSFSSRRQCGSEPGIGRKGRLPQLFLRNHISGTQTFGSLGKGLAGIVIDTAFSFLVSAGAIIKALHRTAAATAVHHATQKILMESQSLIFLGPLFKQVRPVLQKILDRTKVSLLTIAHGCPLRYPNRFPALAQGG